MWKAACGNDHWREVMKFDSARSASLTFPVCVCACNTAECTRVCLSTGRGRWVTARRLKVGLLLPWELLKRRELDPSSGVFPHKGLQTRSSVMWSAPVSVSLSLGAGVRDQLHSCIPTNQWGNSNEKQNSCHGLGYKCLSVWLTHLIFFFFLPHFRIGLTRLVFWSSWNFEKSWLPSLLLRTIRK